MTAAAHLQHCNRTFTPVHRTDVVATLGALWRGKADQTMLVVKGGSPGATGQPRTGRGVWRATRTPLGPGVEFVRNDTSGGIEVDAWGPGAEWLCDRAPILVGGLDDTADFAPQHPLVSELWRRFSAVRIPCTQAVFEALLIIILEQKVTGAEAHRSLGRLQTALSERAPVVPNGPELLLPPDPQVLAGTPSHVLHAAGVELKRSDAIRRAAAYARRLDEAAEVSKEETYRRIQAIPGLGVWTAAEVGLMALGDADAVSVGDYHLKNTTAWALAGEPRGTDEQMVELLDPFRPHRGRVLMLFRLGGIGAPRFGPRITIQQRW
jgi:3-methyladenine DNA glycosylase/8-oxoguanine DNA glycosylase